MFTRRVYYRHGESSMEFFCFQKPFSSSLLSNTDAATREIGYRYTSLYLIWYRERVKNYIRLVM
jgi:hypothetical protein